MQAGSGLEWLSRAAALQICPLCVAAREIETRHLERLADSLGEPGEAVGQFLRAPGLCLDHATLLQQLVLADDRALTRVIDLYLSTLESVADQLMSLEQDGWLETAECPTCVHRDHRIVASTTSFLAAVQSAPEAVDETVQAGGLCVGHFVMTWVNSDESANRDLLRDVQLRAISELTDRVRRLRRRGAAGGPARMAALREACTAAASSISGWTAMRR